MKKIFALMMAVITAFGMTACGSSNSGTTNSNFNYKVGVASLTHTNNTYGYTEGKNGRGAVTTTNVAAVFDQNGKIVKISIDETETNIGFDGAGQLVGYKPGEVKSKKELKDSYGMKGASGIGKEWYQQVDSLENWLVGKDVNALIGNMTGKPNNSNSNTTTSNSVNSNNARGTTLGTNSATTNSNYSTIQNGGNAGTGLAGDVMQGAENLIDDLFGGNYSTNWMGEDLKASVTIDTSYIRYTIQKAYKNAK